MNKIYTLSLVLFSAVLFGSCASKYQAIKPNNINYNVNKDPSGIDFAYKYDVLISHGNKKYANKEKSKSVKVVAVKITNNSNKDLVIADNASIYLLKNKLNLMDPQAIHTTIKQSTGLYYLYLLGSFATLNVGSTTTNGNGGFNSNQQVYPIGLIIGPGLTLFNVLTSSNANKQLLQELEDYSLINKKITKGETVYGLIGVRDISFDPLYLKIED